MEARKYDGEIAPLTGQNHVVAKRNLKPCELLGHYSGMLRKDSETQTVPTRWQKYAISFGRWSIEGWRRGNIFSWVNAPTTHSNSEYDNKEEANVICVCFTAEPSSDNHNTTGVRSVPIFIFFASKDIEK
ncbi:hypothetical protein, partial [Sinorhizobium meliloti]|uniref:hypothetical protein n=1 Tax=Rhizobium meliloti TaxID=382 RepID=UPI001AEF7D1F